MQAGDEDYSSEEVYYSFVEYLKCLSDIIMYMFVYRLIRKLQVTQTQVLRLTTLLFVCNYSN